MAYEDKAKKLIQQLTAASGRGRSPEGFSTNVSQEVAQPDVLATLKNPRRLPRGGLKPVSQAISRESMTQQKVQQAIEFCRALDKEHTGRIDIKSFKKIMQVSGVIVDNLLLVKYTNERQKTVDYAGLVQQMAPSMGTKTR